MTGTSRVTVEVCVSTWRRHGTTWRSPYTSHDARHTASNLDCASTRNWYLQRSVVRCCRLGLGG
jgi:hypothetical protein